MVCIGSLNTLFVTPGSVVVDKTCNPEITKRVEKIILALYENPPSPPPQQGGAMMSDGPEKET